MGNKLRPFLFIILVLILAFFVFVWPRYYPPILMYHNFRVGQYPEGKLAVPIEIFNRQMAFIKRFGYRVIPLEELCRMIKAKKELPHNLVVITFDDGRKSNLAAARILKKYNFPATIFLIENQKQYGEDHLFLRENNIKWIARNTRVNFGSHSRTHQSLSGMDPQALKDELLGSRLKLSKKYGTDFLTLSYPVGAFDRQVMEAARSSRYLCACAAGKSYAGIDLFALRRIKMTEHDLGVRLWGKLSGFYNLLRKSKKDYD